MTVIVLLWAMLTTLVVAPVLWLVAVTMESEKPDVRACIAAVLPIAVLSALVACMLSSCAAEVRPRPPHRPVHSRTATVTASQPAVERQVGDGTYWLVEEFRWPVEHGRAIEPCYSPEQEAAMEDAQRQRCENARRLLRPDGHLAVDPFIVAPAPEPEHEYQRQVRLRCLRMQAQEVADEAVRQQRLHDGEP